MSSDWNTNLEKPQEKKVIDVEKSLKKIQTIKQEYNATKLPTTDRSIAQTTDVKLIDKDALLVQNEIGDDDQQMSHELLKKLKNRESNPRRSDNEHHQIDSMRELDSNRNSTMVELMLMLQELQMDQREQFERQQKQTKEFHSSIKDMQSEIKVIKEKLDDMNEALSQHHDSCRNLEDLL